MTTTTKVFMNVKNVPDEENKVYKRLELRVNSKDQPMGAYWKRRFAEGDIVLESKSVQNNDVGQSVQSSDEKPVQQSKSQKNKESK